MKTTVVKKSERKAQASSGSPKERKIRFASLEQSKAAGDWAVKKYDQVFKRLSQ